MASGRDFRVGHRRRLEATAPLLHLAANLDRVFVYLAVKDRPFVYPIAHLKLPK